MNLSLGGQLILLKYVLSSLHVYVYALSFFKAPSGIFPLSILFHVVFFAGVRIIGKFLGLIRILFV